MTRRMLLDASHPEETRVVVLSGNRLDEFDYETKDKKQLKGNIYLAKVTRVEPSLQAAFVDYGGNRHGFLPFSEIHPDYYRLPIADREALIAEEEAAQRRQSDEDNAAPEGDGEAGDEPDAASEAAADATRRRRSAAKSGNGNGQDTDGEDADDAEVEQVETAQSVETLAGDDIEDAARRRAASLGRYKIQEVIKRRQVMLVQVVKEERGNKGAALTTYLSLAGRYCVLMPNTAKGGGISRKIANAADRKRLKSVLSELNIPDGMAVIVRTAGSNRSKLEIKRDYEYLLRLWDQIRSTTLQSTAPSLIYEEANLIKRAIRDLYTRDMDEILVEGDEGYKAAKAFMRSLMPSHAKKVKKYDDPKVPILHRFQVEGQLDNIHNPTIQLKSGGYIVLNQTEALVAIDVNSGKATKERHIEETALKTNMEAAEEIARQLKLRDLAGLIVIDFIDMDAAKNNREVEQKLKDAMRQDRARIQLGRISPFGLLELSRQRLRPSLHETSTEVCRTCGGSGFVRSPDSTALHVLRALEEEGIKRGGGEVQLTVPTQVALYVLNEKRDRLFDVEQRYGFRVRVATDDRLVPPAHRLDRLSTSPAEERQPGVTAEAIEVPADEELIANDEAEADAPAETSGGDGAAETAGDKGRKRGKRGGRKKAETKSESRSDDGDAADSVRDTAEQAVDAAEAGSNDSEDEQAAAGESEDQASKRRRRRGKRGGRRRSRKREDEQQAGAGEGDSDGERESESESADAGEATFAEPEAEGAQRAAESGVPSDRSQAEIPEAGAAGAESSDAEATPAESAAADAGASGRKSGSRGSRGRRRKSMAAAAEPEPGPDAGGAAAPAGDAEPAEPGAARVPAAPEDGPEAADTAPEDAQDGGSATAPEAEGGAAAAAPEPAGGDAPDAGMPSQAEPAAAGGAADAAEAAVDGADAGHVPAPQPEPTQESTAEPTAGEAPAGETPAGPDGPSRAAGPAQDEGAGAPAPETGDVPEPATAETAFGEAAQPSGVDQVGDTPRTGKRRGWWQKLVN